MLRLSHKLIACSIAARINIPYLLARYLRLFASGRKRGAMISEDLLENDMAELVRLQIYKELDDTWAWVALGPERQQVAAAGAPKATEDASGVDEGAPAVPAPAQVPQPLAWTMDQRLARVEEEVREIRRALGEQLR
ncbi:hypothetical protein Tco_0986169 [Tanacetum coccineum]